MDIQLHCSEKIRALVEKGVDIPNPFSIDLGDEVDIDRISHRNVKIYPGCRIYGAQTVLSAGVELGHEAPVTVDNCRLGPGVRLKGGYFNRSVFLEKANMGSGAQVREGCLLEEEANGAHCVGLKQTILFPFVTLGSLINFCDCLMAGGTSRKDHSEVGSSYIHFNFTPEGDKTTASLIGDVPRGVMLNQKAIFLGGQGGIVGPLRLGYGNVVAANSVLRNDVPEDNKLVVGKTYSGKVIDYRARAYPNLRRIIEANFLYLANLTALEQWYLHVRRPFFDTVKFGSLVFEGAMNTLARAKKERLNRLKVLAEKVKLEGDQTARASLAAGAELFSNMPEIEDLFFKGVTNEKLEKERDGFLAALEKQDIDKGQGYIALIQALPTPVSQQGTAWLQSIVDFFCEQAEGKVTSIKSVK